MMIVLKFGGSSVATPARVRAMMEIAVAARAQRGAVAVVCSAFGGATDALVRMCDLAERRDESWREELEILKRRHRDAVADLVGPELREETRATIDRKLEDLEDTLHGIHLIRECSKRSRDYVMAFGERLSCFIISRAARSHLDDVAYLDARQIIRTDDNHGLAVVDWSYTERAIKAHFATHAALQITTGFIASSEEGRTTTLGRGGSDYTASILGAALDCEEIQIWTDVNGVLTADPRMVAGAFPMPHLTYIEAMELSHFGAKVIYAPTMAPAMRKRVPLHIKNTFAPEEPGTVISDAVPSSKYHVHGISSITSVTVLQVSGSGLVGVAGVANRLFGALAEAGVSVILISQASSEHSICIAVSPDQGPPARAAISETFALEIERGQVDEVVIEPDLAVVAVVGEGMRRRPGIASRIFGALGRNAINVVAVAQGSSERNISFVINRENVRESLNVLHEAFFATASVTHVYLIGTGLIGTELCRQIAANRARLREERNVELILQGVANSRKMLISEEGLDPAEVTARLDSEGVAMDLGVFAEQARRGTNRVLVDCTAGPEIAARYPAFLRHGISVVTPNKIANTGSYTAWSALHSLARGPRVGFYCEANVGADLPVLSSLRQLRASGDRVVGIEAVLSGTLSYLFNSYEEGMSFGELVAGAREKGFTEPDPRDDLSGVDVARKILILARESGLAMEPEDVAVESLVPEACAEAPTVEAFLEGLKAEDAGFEARLQAAKREGRKLRYLAVLTNGRASTGLFAVGPDHPCYRLEGADNLISITTERYCARPLVIQGPGAGAEVTAARVFAEIIEAADRARLSEVANHPD